VAKIDQVIGAWIEPAVVRTASVGSPWIYLLEFVFWLALMGAFFGTLGFLNALPANLSDRSLPIGWEAAIPNHGALIRWYLRENHPVAFGFTVFGFLASLGGMFLVHRAEIRIRQSNGSEARIGKFAAIALTAAVLFISYLGMTQLPREYMVPASFGSASTGR
jgi:hypothetical protein